VKASGDRVIGRSGDQKKELTAEQQRCGEETSEHLITETQRRGERSRNRDIGKSGDRKGRQDTRSYQGKGFSRAVTGKNIWASAPVVLERVMSTVRATLREIFDESAYDRFLLRTHESRSVASYREFTRERDAAMLKKPRCC
jgi:hypothetical protein